MLNHPSEPAQMILENLSSFSKLQQAHIEQMPETVQEKIFKMAGFQKESGKSARVLIEAGNVEEPVHIPSGQRFQVGNLCFETNKDFTVCGNRIVGIYTKWEESVTDYSYILDEEYPRGGAVFTRQPKAGMELYLVLDGMLEAGDDLIFYVQLADDYHRNVFDGKNIFAHIQWQIYTRRGFMDMRCKDETGSFLTSGELSFRIPKEEAIIFEELPQKGYVLRGTLKRADYDIFPKIKKISAFLFEVWQKETKSVCYTYSGRKQFIEVSCDILEKGKIQVFCKENKEDGFYLYEKKSSQKNQGRFYRLVKMENGRYRITFDKEEFGFAPGNFENAVKLVSYDEEMMERCELGKVYGYDNQKITLPIKHIVKESFSMIAEKQNEDGEKVYYFIRPSSTKEGEFHYTLMENEGIIKIDDAADFIDSRIFLAGCAVSQGAAGNIRAGCIFQPMGLESRIIFRNPAAGKSGCFPEEIEDVKQRLIADLRKHYTAVEAQDYENLVKMTPELCIDKVKAVRDDEKNQILITVKPVSNQPFSGLSEIYEKAIRRQLEKARLLTVNIELQQPVYVPVHVRGIIYVKLHHEDSRKQMEDVIKRQLDYITTERNFGERFHFDTFFREIESLDCVKYIYDLSVSLSNQVHAIQDGFDIQPKENCLLYPGEICLELRTTE